MQPTNRILHPDISPTDAAVSAGNLTQLQHYVTRGDHSLVFFVGAGASTAGNTGMPRTPDLLHQLFADAVRYAGVFNSGYDDLMLALKEISWQLGFEITMNDFWQICRQTITLLFEAFGILEDHCPPNRIHAFLAYWLGAGGTVVTTNYDRLIERQAITRHLPIQSRYSEEDRHSFDTWQEDLTRGGCLFKIHGSLDDPKSCLGALEDVGTQLAGNRGDFLTEIVCSRPLCFVGWRGVDPDIPPLLHQALDSRDPSLPTFWLHYEGKLPGTVSLESAIQGTSPLVRPYASDKPILSDADRAFGEILQWIGIHLPPNPDRKPDPLDFSHVVEQCSRSGVTRMVAIALRRAGRLDFAGQVLDGAVSLAANAAERSAALQEISLLEQQRLGRNTDQARDLLAEAREALKNEPDPWLQLNADFGLLSMTIVALRQHPWMIVKTLGLFRKYRQDIEFLRTHANDKETLALHESLFNLYLGRLRFKLFGWLGVFISPIAGWILKPFNTARSMIGDAKDIHLHSRIDVLAYRLTALASLRHCQKISQDLAEVDRLIAILNDQARAEHWKNQRDEITQKCMK